MKALATNPEGLDLIPGILTVEEEKLPRDLHIRAVAFDILCALTPGQSIKFQVKKREKERSQFLEKINDNPGNCFMG